MTVLILSLVLALAGCTGLILAGRGMWQGWLVGLAVQPVWAAFAIVTRGYGLLLTCLMYGTVYGRNLRAWRHKQRTASANDYGDELQRTAWLAGYEWALTHPDDDGVVADRARLTTAAG